MRKARTDPPGLAASSADAEGAVQASAAEAAQEVQDVDMVATHVFRFNLFAVLYQAHGHGCSRGPGRGPTVTTAAPAPRWISFESWRHLRGYKLTERHQLQMWVTSGVTRPKLSSMGCTALTLVLT